MVAPEIVVVTVFGGFVLLAWAPLLAIERLRALFVWPTRWVAVNYLVVGAGLIVVQCLFALAVVVLVAGTGQVTGGDASRIVGGVVTGNVLVPGVGALTALSALPARGYWSPDSDGLDGRVALCLGVVWYALVASVAFVLIAVGIMFANLPT